MILIDTHTLIYILFASSNLSENARNTISSGEKVYVSIASLWEIAIKQSLGKLELDCSIDDIAAKCSDLEISILPIEPKHLSYISKLPDIHRDPFDRLIISQAITEGMPLVTRDTIIPKYDNLKVIW